jgi:hydrogenase expression/formation protein HypC
MCLAVPGKIIEIRGEDPIDRMGIVDFGGVTKDINLSFVSEARIGDYVLVHAGFALNTIDEAEAKRVFEYLREIDELGVVDTGERGPDGIDPPGLVDTDERDIGGADSHRRERPSRSEESGA